MVLVYVFQIELFYDPLNHFQFNPKDPQVPQIDTWKLVFSKAFRYLLNDVLGLMVIWGLFQNRTYLQFAVYVFLFGFFILLPIYLVLVTNFYVEARPFLNHLHRVVLNPVLMMLLIPAFYCQQSLRTRRPR